MELTYYEFPEELRLAARFQLIELLELRAKEFDDFEVNLVYIEAKNVSEGSSCVGIHVELPGMSTFHPDCPLDTLPKLVSLLAVEHGINFFL